MAINYAIFPENLFIVDALWVMSLIPPSIYLFDIIKVIVFILLNLIMVISLEALYLKITKKFRHGKRIKYKNDEDISKLLIENRKLYERNFQIFLCIIVGFLTCLSVFLKIKASLIMFPILGALIGIVFILILDKTLTRKLKLVVVGVLLMIGSVLHGEYKYIHLFELPLVKLTAKQSGAKEYRLLEMSKTNAVIFQRNKNGTNSFKIVDLNQIHSIQSVIDN